MRPSPLRSAKSMLNPVTTASGAISMRCSRNAIAPGPAPTFSNQKMRRSMREPPTTSRSPSPSRSNGCALMGTTTRASSCSTQASPSSGSSGSANHETGCFSVVPRGGFWPPLFAATTSGRPSSSKSARKTRMYDPRPTVEAGMVRFHRAVRPAAPGFSK